MKNDEKASENRFCKEFVEIVQLMVDGEATEAHRERFQNYYAKCKHCLEYYDIESSTIKFIRETFKSDAHDRGVPTELAGNIRNHIVASA